MKTDAPNATVNTTPAPHNAIKLPRLDQQAQKWRFSLESEILKHQAPVSLATPVQTAEWAGPGHSEDHRFSGNLAVTEPGSVRAGTFVPGHVDPPPIQGQAQLLRGPAHQAWTQTLGMWPHAIAPRNISTRTYAIINTLPPSPLQREFSATPSANHWQFAKQGDGVVLTYVGPAVAEGPFREMAVLCCHFMKEQGIRVVRVVNNGITVWDETDLAGTYGRETPMDNSVQSDSYIINKKY